MIASLAVALVPTALSLAPAASSGPGGGAPLAPDGRRGFGADVREGELLKLFRTPDEDERAFLDELDWLQSDLRVLVSTVEGLYRSRGYFALVEDTLDPDLEDLHARFWDLDREPFGADDAGEAVAEAFARMHFDTRLRVRARLLAGWERDSQELRDGLRVLRAASDGFVVLSDDEAQAIARRLDLAGARLRALYKDLDALRETPGQPAAAPADGDALQRFLSLRRIADVDLRQRAHELAHRAAEESAAGMWRWLFSAQLEPEIASLLVWRDDADRRAQQLLLASRAAFPRDDEDAASLPASLRAMRKTERLRAARARALEGLALHPLSAELAYAAAVSSRVVGGELEALGHYDRFLALHGIRYHDARTYEWRRLSWEEADALLYVQEYQQREAPSNVQ